ncbi:PIN domain-containing protein [Paenibacillus silagei]|uniref:Nucleic acid-binding protein n=1 Tax=Paenibacillus silagei TaxID=1670801 RepID=A0ABS4P0H8_9BACL|nr:PIN domain-containing protein [Paenibacillus silagei]MBP2115195.1 putative nucleic acid-binding protein [Paenibacillus silagei]
MTRKKTEIWIDTNIIIYALRTNKDFSPQARQLITAAAEGEYMLKVSPIIVSECVFVLMGKQFNVKKAQVKEALTSFINLKGIECEEKAVIEEALDQFSKKGIDFVDAYLAAHAKAITPAHVITLNVKDFLKLGVTVQTPIELMDIKPNT